MMKNLCKVCGNKVENNTICCPECGYEKSDLEIIYDFLEVNIIPAKYKSIRFPKWKYSKTMYLLYTVLLHIIGCLWWWTDFASFDKGWNLCIIMMILFYCITNIILWIKESKINISYVYDGDDNLSKKEIYSYLKITIRVVCESILLKKFNYVLIDRFYVDSKPIKMLSIIILSFIIVIVVGIIVGSAWFLGGKVGECCEIRSIKQIKDINTYNENIYKLRKVWKIKNRQFECLSNIKSEKIIVYVARAIRLCNEKNYEDALANIRRTLECYLNIKAQCDKLLFENQEQVSIFNIIEYYENKSEGVPIEKLHYIRKMCNSNVHTSAIGDNQEVSQEKIGKIIREMLEILFEEEQMFADYAKRKTFIKENITVYINRTENHIKRNNDMDALLNIRKTLEMIINGYLFQNCILCIENHEKNTKGYIDFLYEKRYISEGSEKNMQKLRMAGNIGAHMGREVSKEKLYNLVEILKIEVNKLYEVLEDKLSCKEENKSEKINFKVELDSQNEDVSPKGMGVIGLICFGIFVALFVITINYFMHRWSQI